MSTSNLPDFLTPSFIESLLREYQPDRPLRVCRLEALPVDNSASILVTLTAGHAARPIGHFGLVATIEEAGQYRIERLVLKLKPRGREISAMLASLAAACGGTLAATYPTFAEVTGFHHTHHREIALYRQPDPDLMPRISGLLADDDRACYAVLMEYLGDEVTLLNSVQTPESWTDAHLRAALTQLARWHARHLTSAPPPDWPDLPNRPYHERMRPLWAALIDHAGTHFPDLYTPRRVRQLRQGLDQLAADWDWLDNRLKTLVHNDLNPRNACFRRGGGTPQLCVYDWELATYHVPVYDVIELLSFVLGPDRYAQRGRYLDEYRRALHERSGHYADARAFRREARIAALDFGWHRLGMYLMAHRVSPYPFLPRVVESYFNTLDELSAE
jgi:hypothetical protein